MRKKEKFKLSTETSLSCPKWASASASRGQRWTNVPHANAHTTKTIRSHLIVLGGCGMLG